MPCSKYKSSKQRKLCFATHGWKDWDFLRRSEENGIQNKKEKINIQEKRRMVVRWVYLDITEINRPSKI